MDISAMLTHACAEFHFFLRKGGNVCLFVMNKFVCVVPDKQGYRLDERFGPVSPYAGSVWRAGTSRLADRFPLFIHCSEFV